MDPRTKDLSNQTVGQWTVLRYDGIIKNNAHWYCRCSCGIEKSVKAQYLLNGTSSKCQKCGITKRANITDTIPVFYWRHVITNANKRGIALDITKEECFSLLVKQNYKCAISGMDIYLSKNSVEHNSEKKTTASLDRIDSSKPYEPGNVQWLHKDINMMKHVFTQEYFIHLCELVVQSST